MRNMLLLKKIIMENNIEKKVKRIFFNETLHKYTDDGGIPYTSMTQCIGKYVPVFQSKKVAIKCSMSKNSMYYGWKVSEILDYWKKINKDACEKGTMKHDYLETVVKKSSGYNLDIKTNLINDELYTIDTILENYNSGRLDLDYFVKTGIDKKYPEIYFLIRTLVEKGWRIYSEIGVYSYELLISGLIDILLIKDDSFIILDWKTNKDSLVPYNDSVNMFKSGYYKKDKNGNQTENYIFTNEYLLPPLNTLQNSTFIHYILQLSGYSYLVEKYNLKLKKIILAHIRGDEDKDGVIENVEFYEVPYYKDEVEKMFVHHFNNHCEKQRKIVI